MKKAKDDEKKRIEEISLKNRKTKREESKKFSRADKTALDQSSG